MKYIGLDVGEKRVGIAVSDDGGTVAFPLAQVRREECVEYVKKIIKEKEIQTVIIGESLDLDGKENSVMKEIHAIADEIRKFADVIFEPEQFSTQQVKRLGKGSDAEAATIILQSYLDRYITDEEINFS